MIKRVLAAIAGALTLFLTATFTLGTVLVAPIGVLVARGLARRKNRPLSRGAAWLGAVIAAFLAVPLVLGGLFLAAPPGTADAVRSAMDSAQANQKPAQLPPWLERVTPPATARQRAASEQLASSRPFLVIFGTIGVVMACSILGTIAGSIGWAASMLGGYAITGRWIPSGEAAPVPPLAEE